MTDWSNLKDAMKRQQDFSELFFKNENLTERQKEEQLKTFALALHAEVTGIKEVYNPITNMAFETEIKNNMLDVVKDHEKV